MRALRLEGPGIEGLRLAARPDPRPGPGDVVVRLRAAALNHRDLWCCRGWQGGAPSAILGSDGAGIVEALGPGVGGWRIGQDVLINPSLGWADDSPAPGPGFEILGIPTDGTLAELIRIPATQLVPKPAHLDWPQAAALPLSTLTAYRALFDVGELGRGQSCVIVGIGGGTALQGLLLARAAGARVFVTSRDAAKRRRAEALGAELALDGGTPWSEQVLAATGGAGADVVLENIGRPSWPQSLAALGRGGRLVVYGSTGGDRVETDLVPLFLGWRSIRGTTMGSAAAFRRMLALVGEHRIIPVVDRVLPFAEVVTGFRRLDRGEQFGKIVVVF